VVFVAETAAVRSAVATEPHTTVVVVGGPADRPLPVSPFEFWFRADAPYQRGDYREAIEIVAESLEQWPDHPIIHYQLACYYALANDREQALDHLTRAIAEDESLRQQAIIDSDFASLNGSTAFIGLTTQ
jgi:tetratricopeptide (TPR) repeat protein